MQKEFGHFVPLRSLGVNETNRFFKEYARNFESGDCISKLVVYCDSHRSLVSVCNLHGVPHRHPPPGATNKCPVIERKINHMLAGVRAYLVSGSLPMCFWPFAGECFSFNDNLKLRFNEDGSNYVPYTEVIGEPFNGSQFVTGQLVFYKPAPTVKKLPKIGDRLSPGIFLKYYVSGGRWNNQYIVADLEGFAHKNLHHAIGPLEFKLKLSRTEVVKYPPWTDEPIFPTEAKFRACNYTLEGVEKKDTPDVPDSDGTVEKYQDYVDKAPEITDDEIKRFSEIYTDEEEIYPVQEGVSTSSPLRSNTVRTSHLSRSMHVDMIC